MGTAVASFGDLDKLNGANPFVVPAVVAGGMVSMPLWLETLRDWSEVAADLAPLVGFLIGLVTLYKAARRGAPVAHVQKRKLRDGLKESALAFSKKGGVVAVVALMVLALVALAAHLIKPRRDALPLTLISTAPAARKRSKDDAGDEGEADQFAVDGAPPWYNELLKLKGQHEGTSRKPNPVIQALFADSGFPGVKDTEATPWCAAAIGASLKRAGLQGSNSLMARSYLNYGVPLTAPRLGCIVVIWRGSKTSASGHVFFYAGEDATHVYGLGGNQSDAVTVAKFPKSRVLGYRWPRKPTELRTLRGAAASASASAAAAISGAVAIAEQAETVKPALQKIGTPVALSMAQQIAFACACVALVFAIYTAVRRVADYFDGK